MNYTKDNFIELLKKRKQQPKEYNLESITLEGKKFINVPSVRDSKTGKSLGFSSKTLTDLYALLDANITEDVIDFSKYKTVLC
ncbi:MAG: hypothetical protein MRZ40_09195 [Ligilactobacillus animalis]|uniref:hypothetical protein n=1 Tax=Ligilactobacillus animalis TaxID=1605 RepID=UPI00242D4BB2|nr:hypothetical protein [Ligilactobacillus animalis]MCI5942726.1 hypothetical protein [Ligilactobacillus animalis]